ncbi:MAG: DUF4147 domain-containing protein [Chloroflexi bacterium]|nr:DUF4147 domain-containing protein [Chloroflexota bacterium]
MIIQNTKELLSHGDTGGRRIVLEVLEAGLRASDPYDNVRRLVRVQDGKLIVGYEDEAGPQGQEPLVFDLSQVGHIYVIGGGKAAQRQAMALEDALGDLITGGHVNAKKGDRVQLKRIEVTLAGHPIPDEDSVEGARKILEVARKARKGDIVFFSESGGGSALLTLPAPGISLQDLRDLSRVLYFEHGAPMWDTNAVRTLLTVLRSREVRYVGEATFIQVSTDERPPRLRVHVARKNQAELSSDDAYKHAIEILKRYDCWDRVSESIRQFLLAADPQYAFLTPEERARMHYYRVAGPEMMLGAAQSRARELGLNAMIVASSLSDVEARCVGEVLAYMAQEIEVYGRPLTPPCILLCGGELLVTVGESTGVGGRNQEFVLSTAPRLAGSSRAVAASVDSDGNDGPTEFAGGIVDGLTMNRAREAGFDVFQELRNHNSSGVLQQLGDAIYTGVRGTNVQDLRVVYVGDP